MKNDIYYINKKAAAVAAIIITLLTLGGFIL